MSFADLGLSRPILRAIEGAGYKEPTPIQRQAIPPACEGKDLLGCAQTGTGKTAAFALPILHRVDTWAGDEPKVLALIVTPTRELAAQIGSNLKTYSQELDLWHTVIFGGVKENPQIEAIRKGVDVLVATPGRLLDLHRRRLLSLQDVKILVLDEADQMLDMGFVHAIREIVKALPKREQTMLFSATMPKEIRELAMGLLKDPVQVAVAPVAAPAEMVEQKLLFVDKGDKRKLLVEILNQPQVKQTLVFSRTKHGANRIVRELEKAKIEAAAIHGNKSQGARTRALNAFREGSLKVLVATDIAARGIDVAGVSHVVNFDLPNVPETYVHRIGRTARAGRQGVAYSFCDVEEREYLVDIERLVQQHLVRVEDHPFLPSQAAPPMTQLDGRQAVRARKKKSARSRGRSGSSARPGGQRRPTQRRASPSGARRAQGSKPRGGSGKA